MAWSCSVPHTSPGGHRLLSELTAKLGPDNYQVFFQEPGLAEAALEADVRATVLGALFGISGEAVEVHTTTEVDGTTMPDHSDEVLPGWLSEADVDYYTAEFGPDRLPRRTQLVPQPPSKLGVHVGLASGTDQSASNVCRGSSQSSF